MALGVARGGVKRNFLLGALGVRDDGAIVTSTNGSCIHPAPAHHAEARLCRKLDKGSTVYVARVAKDGTPAMAKPCPSCMSILRAKRVAKVIYTTGKSSYEVLYI